LKVKIRGLIIRFLLIAGFSLIFLTTAGGQDFCKKAGERGGIPVEPDHLLLNGVVKSVQFVKLGPELQWCKVKTVAILRIDVKDAVCEGEKDFYLSPQINQLPRIDQPISFAINKNECRDGEVPVIISLEEGR